MSTAVSGISLLYRTDRIHLWVEDEITRAYLDELWQDASIQIHIGGGNQSIRSVVADAENQNFSHVFGLTDRDFSQPSNYAQWANPASLLRTFVLPVHEVENYLIDSDAIANCDLNTNGRDVASISNHLIGLARACEWQVSASLVVAKWRDQIVSGFPTHPNRQIVFDQASAIAYLSNQAWYTSLGLRLGQLTAHAEPVASLTNFQTAVATWLAGNSWRREMPGKELFHDVRGYVYSLGGSGAQRNIDLAMSIARWQFQSSNVPPELHVLHTELHRKAGF